MDTDALPKIDARARAYAIADRIGFPEYEIARGVTIKGAEGWRAWTRDADFKAVVDALPFLEQWDRGIVAQRSSLTRDAIELLAQVDAGGVPGFMTSNLRRIAIENGMAVSPATTPNEVIDALRGKAKGDAP